MSASCCPGAGRGSRRLTPSSFVDPDLLTESREGKTISYKLEGLWLVHIDAPTGATCYNVGWGAKKSHSEVRKAG